MFSICQEHLLPKASSVLPHSLRIQPRGGRFPTRHAGSQSSKYSSRPNPQCSLSDWHKLQEDLRGVGGRHWTSQESEDLGSRRHHLALNPISLPKRRDFCSNGDSPAKQKSEKPVRQLCGFLKQVQQEWPRLGRLLSNLGQKGFLFVFEKANLVFLNLVLSICTPNHPNLLCALLQQKTTLISLRGL